MAAVLRKNHAWLHSLLKNHLSQIVPELLQHNILPAEAQQAALLERVSPQHRATYVLDMVEKKMKEHADPCNLGLEFMKVISNSDVGLDQSALDNLKLTADEFTEEQSKAASRRSSDQLDSSSSGVFSSPEKTSEKCQGITGNAVGTTGRRRLLSEGNEFKSTESNSSEYKHSRSFSEPAMVDEEQLPLQNKFVCNNSEREVKGDNLESPALYPASLVESALLPSIAESPSPDLNACKKFPSVATPTEPSISPLAMQSEAAGDQCETACIESDNEDFSARESSIMEKFVHAVQETDGTDDQGVMQAEYDRMLKHYQQKLEQAESAYLRETKKLRADVEYHKRVSEEREQHLLDKDRQLQQVGQELQQRKGQVANNEREIYELQKEKKRIEDEMESEEKIKLHEINKLQSEKEEMEKECTRLRNRLHNKEKQLSSLEQSIKQRQLDLELHRNMQLLHLSNTDTERNDKEVIEKKMKQWEEMKKLVDRLFKKGSDVTQTKRDIVQQLNAIKHTGMHRRPSTVPVVRTSLVN